MRAHRIERFGGPDVLQARQMPVPAPKDGEVLIRVAYCGVCRHDLLTRQGAFPKVGLPVTLGHQVSGEVMQAGDNVSMPVGTRVLTMIYSGCGECAQCQAGNDARCLTQRPLFLGEDCDGGYADYVCVSERTVVLLPDTVDLAQAAILTCTLGTAYHALTARGRVTAGQRVVITGASGGVGLHAVQVAHLLGAHVTGVVSSEDKRDVVVAAGADDVIVAPDRSFARAFKAGHRRGADVVIDVVGAPTLVESIHAVAEGGTVVVVGNVEGQSVTLFPAHVILKEITLVGTKSCSSEEMRSVLREVENGTLRPEVTEVVPMTEVAAVHAGMESGWSLGRVVLSNEVG
jgi:2-desacetyl-2-hydroxyethyl bacteriochlorophyllide A dehydrogenase